MTGAMPVPRFPFPAQSTATDPWPELIFSHPAQRRRLSWDILFSHPDPKGTVGPSVYVSYINKILWATFQWTR